MSDYEQKLDQVFQPSAPAETAEPADPITLPTTAEIERQSYAWAADVFWVYERLGSRPSQEKAGGKNGRYALWQDARKDVGRFVNQILPKAMVLLEKARAKEGDSDEIDIIEGKDIAHLEAVLRAALKEQEALDGH